MIEQGRIANVVIRPNGSELAADALIAATSIVVEDVYDFNQTGGSLLLNDQTITYTGWDATTGTITLAAGLAAAASAGDTVTALPRGESKWAQVDLEDGDEGTFAIIPSNWAGSIEDGIRDEAYQEIVYISDEKGRWEVVGIDDEVPTVSGVAVGDDGVPAPLPVTAPTVSPAILSATGTTSTIILEMEVVQGGATADVYVSDSPSFTADSTLWIGNTRGPVFVASHSGDGQPFLPGSKYYFATIASNALGAAPQSADVEGELDLDNVDALIAAKLVVGFILAGTITVGAITIDTIEGIKVVGPGGQVLLHIPADGTSPIEAVMQIVTDKLNVSDNLSIGGNAQLMGNLKLANGIVNPTVSPALSFTHPSYASAMYLSGGKVYNYGMCALASDNTKFITAGMFVGNTYLRVFNTADGTLGQFPDPTNGKTWGNDFLPYGGICHLGSYYYVLGLDLTRSNEWYIYKISDTTFDKVDESPSLGTYMTGAFPRIVADILNSRIYHIWVSSGNDLRVRGLDASWNLVTAGTTIVSGLSSRLPIGGADVGNFEGTGNKLYIGFSESSAGGQVRCFDVGGGGTTFVEDTARKFNRASSSMQGLMWDSPNGQFIDYDYSATMHRYGKYAQAQAFKAKQAWLDSNATGGTHETMAGPVSASYTLPARAYLSVTTDPPPDLGNTDPLNTDKADQVAVYLSKDGGTTYFKDVYTSVTGWGRSYASLTIIGDPGSPATSKATNEFLTAATNSPGRVQSLATDAGALDYGISQNLIDLFGSGVFRLGNYTSTRHISRRTRGSNLTVPTASATDINFGTSLVTTGVTWDNANNRWVVNKAGVYMVSGLISWQDGNATGRRTMLARRYTGGAWTTIAAHDEPANAQNVTNHISIPIECAAGDYIAFQAYQNSGADRTVAGGADERCWGAVAFMAQ